MSTESSLKQNGLTYALDIGTRSVIGMVVEEIDEKVQVIAVETQPHTKRTMMDGQIEDIAMVANVVRTVTDKLEEKLGVKLTSASVAAAGRALRTEQGISSIVFDTPQTITAESISRLEAQAVSDAEKSLNADKEQRMYLVGYTNTQTLVDNYPMRSILNHVGKTIETNIVATFLPSEVIESLYAVMNMAGVEIASLTLEPIAALNAAIPAELRLLNLALVDIGAGTSDIAICRDGSVIGYTMATIAGDELTETLMKKCLIDYNTAERMKAALSDGSSVSYVDIMGIEQRITPKEIEEHIKPASDALVNEIAERILQINDGAPSAVFLAGGGSKLAGICAKVARALEMDETRVAIAGGHFKKSAFSNEIDINTPEYTTPLGIAVSAALGLISDSYRVSLNGEAAKLFRSGSLTVLEILMMNGYTYQDLLGKNGKNLVVEVDGMRRVFAGQTAVPAVLKVNGETAQPSHIINAGDKIEFTAAKAGVDACLTVQELLEKVGAAAVTVNSIHMQPSAQINTGDVIAIIAKAPKHSEKHGVAQKKLKTDSAPQEDKQSESKREKAINTLKSEKPQQEKNSTETLEKNSEKTLQEPLVSEVEKSKPQSAPSNEIGLILNGKPLSLEKKSSGQPYYLMDLLEHTDIDFDKVKEPVELFINGDKGTFQQAIAENDNVIIRCMAAAAK